MENNEIKNNIFYIFTMQTSKIDFFSIPIDALTMEQVTQRIDNCIQKNEHLQHVVVNSGKVVAMQTDKDLYDSVVSCDLINADGQGVVWAARFLGKYLPERVTGIDLMQRLITLAVEKKYTCFFLGAKEEVVVKVVDIYTQKYGNDLIAGYRNGYFSADQEAEVAQQIADSKANLLFVAITSPKKEIFLTTYKDILRSVNFTMGVGGSFDVIAGVTKRAPLWMQKNGLEWFFRLIQEPRRMWRRYIIGNYQFMKLVLKEKRKMNK